jgi:hypothetical protein
VETKKLYATGAGSPSKVYCYSYDELGRQKKIVELQGAGLSQSCATAVAFRIVPPPSYSFAAVAGRWAAKHSFGITLVLGFLCSLLFVIWIGRERTRGTQRYVSPQITRITQIIRVLLRATHLRPSASFAVYPLVVLCDLCASVVQSVRNSLSVIRSLLSGQCGSDLSVATGSGSVHPRSSIFDPRSASRFRLRLFPVLCALTFSADGFYQAL